MNDFLKECVGLRSLYIVRTNLGGLMRNCKNVNMFRDLRATRLEYANLTGCGLNNASVERIVAALRANGGIRRVVLGENWDIDSAAL